MSIIKISDEIHTELINIISSSNYESIEFGISGKLNLPNFYSKIVVWFIPNMDKVKKVYKRCCKKLNLHYNENKEGCYLYIKVAYKIKNYEKLF